MEVITKRPENMSFEKWRSELKENQKKIKKYLREGRICFVSWKIVEFENPVSKEKEKRISRNPNPFRGIAKKLKFI